MNLGLFQLGLFKPRLFKARLFQKVRSQLTAKLFTADLADSRGLQAFNEYDLIRDLEVGDLTLAHPALQVDSAGGSLVPGDVWNDKCTAALAQKLIGNGHHRHVKYLRMSQQMILNLLRRDLLAGTIDMIRSSTLNDQITLRGSFDDISGTIETVLGERALIDSLFIVIASNGVGSACQQIPGLSLSNGLAQIIHNQNFVVQADRSPLCLH